MYAPAEFSFIRYLAAKKSVDDRALNRHVLGSLVAALPATTSASPLRVLEVGAGIGTMLERLLDWGVLTDVLYTAIDADPVLTEEAHHRLVSWAADKGFRVEKGQGQLFIQRELLLSRSLWTTVQRSQATRFRLPGSGFSSLASTGLSGNQREGQHVFVELEAIDVFDFVNREQGQRTWDLLIAHAFMDLMDVPTALPPLLSLLRPGGLFYFTIVFDGATVLQPTIDATLDTQLEALYHQTMDERITDGKPSGDSRTGRHLFDHLRAVGAELIDAGASDWVVFAGPAGYPADEAYFLHFIIHTIYAALQGHPHLDAARFSDWITKRHTQVEDGSLVYIAHQLDFLGRSSPHSS